MASMQCFKPKYETRQQKCHESSHGHKVADMNSCGMKGNHHGGLGYGIANSETYKHGQTLAYYPDHNMAKTQAQYHGQTQSHHPDHTMSKTHETYKYQSKTNGHGHPSDHGQANGHHASHGISLACQMKTEKKVKETHASRGVSMSCQMKTEKKIKEKGSEYKKEKIFYKKKSKASKKSCSDNDGSSGSDSD
uniref:Uncharacterized protein n=1 Tax=Quercus lobata TaxID=97700 RepID=A0A7N2KVU6_QUELO